jgi:hypothetical protein
MSKESYSIIWQNDRLFAKNMCEIDTYLVAPRCRVHSDESRVCE